MKPPPASHVHRRPWVSHIDSSFGSGVAWRREGMASSQADRWGCDRRCVGTCLMQMHVQSCEGLKYRSIVGGTSRKESERPTTPPVRESPTHYCITNVAL